LVAGLVGAYLAYVLYARVPFPRHLHPTAVQATGPSSWAIQRRIVWIGRLATSSRCIGSAFLTDGTPSLQEARDRIISQGISLQARLRYQQAATSPWTVIENFTCGMGCSARECEPVPAQGCKVNELCRLAELPAQVCMARIHLEHCHEHCSHAAQQPVCQARKNDWDAADLPSCPVPARAT
jgi:hypothetical protein